MKKQKKRDGEGVGCHLALLFWSIYGAHRVNKRGEGGKAPVSHGYRFAGYLSGKPVLDCTMDRRQ